MNPTLRCSIRSEPKDFAPVRRLALATVALLLALAPSVVRAGWPTIIYPSDPGITWAAGQTYTIEWASVPLDPLPIHLIKWLNADTFAEVKVISSACPNPDSSGTFSWTVPNNIPSGASYGIEVGVLGVAVAFSDNPFAISGGGSGPPQKPAKITVEANPSYGGIGNGTGTYAVGSQQQISASPAPCFIFTGWADGNTDNPRTVTVSAGGATYTANFANILVNSVQPYVDTDKQTMRATFVPQGHDAHGNEVTLAQAPNICGVDHFNWIQYLIRVPPHWTITLGPLGIGPTVSPPLLDPIDSTLLIYKITSANSPGNYDLMNPWPGNEPWDAAPFYWNESGELGRHTHDGTLFFNDSAGFASWMLDTASHDYVMFLTYLAGIKADGSFKTWDGVGANFYWKTDATLDGLGGVIDYGTFKVADPTNAPTLLSGGVFDVSSDSPSPLGRAKLQMTVNFVPAKIDQAMLTASFTLPSELTLTNRHVVLTIGGVSVDFATDSKGKGATGMSRLNFRSKNGIGYLTAALKGDWDTNWTAAGLSNITIKNKRVTMPVLLTFDASPPMLFGGDVPLRYTGTLGKTGSARYKPN